MTEKPKAKKALKSVTFEFEDECACEQVDIAQLGTVSVHRWRELSTERKVCAIALCRCQPVRRCRGTNCGVTYCIHHGQQHQDTVRHNVSWDYVESVPLAAQSKDEK